MFDKIISGFGRIFRGVFGFREEVLKKREERTGMRQSYGAMIAKLAVGAFFVSATMAYYDSGEETGLIIFAAGIAISFLAWGLVPFLRGRKKIKLREARLARQQEIAEMERIMNMPLDTFHNLDIKNSMQKLDGTLIEDDDTPEEIELKMAKEMLREGLITEADYERKKNMILGFSEADQTANNALAELEGKRQEQNPLPPQ